MIDPHVGNVDMLSSKEKDNLKVKLLEELPENVKKHNSNTK